MNTKKNGNDGLPHVPVSWGELIDKVTILEIKERRLTVPAALANVRKELALLTAIIVEAGVMAEAGALKARLTAVNERLWDIEDEIRIKEGRGEFDDGFIRLARSVYIENDERAAIKREINLLLASQLIEEKGYAPYRGPQA